MSRYSSLPAEVSAQVTIRPPLADGSPLVVPLYLRRIAFFSSAFSSGLKLPSVRLRFSLVQLSTSLM